MEIICINCPVGCRLKVKVEGGEVKEVAGNACKRGEAYARQECVAPMRMVTAVIPVEGSRTPLSVKTAAPIPKHLLLDCMEALAGIKLKAPISAKSVVLKDVLGTGVDIIATKSVKIDL